MSKSNLKVLTVVGTRPEIIRLSRVMALLDEHVNHVIAHTGQNYDYELNEIFFKDLELRKPDHFLNVDVSSLEASVGDIMKKSGELLRKERPDGLLILGDTNSCLAAYMAKRMHIPIFHMEAGNRCFDFNVPEEINRRIVDHISDFNLVDPFHLNEYREVAINYNRDVESFPILKLIINKITSSNKNKLKPLPLYNSPTDMGG